MNTLRSASLPQAQAQNISGGVASAANDLSSWLVAPEKVVSPSELVRDVALQTDLVERLRVILADMHAEIANKTLQAADADDQHTVTIVRMADQECFLLALPENLLSNYGPTIRDALNSLRTFFMDNIPGARLLILHQNTPHVTITVRFPKLFKTNGLSLDFLPAKYLDDLKGLQPAEQAQTLMELLGLTPAPIEREITINDLKQIQKVMMNIGLTDKADLKALLRDSDLRELTNNISLDGLPTTIVSDLVDKVANAGPVNGRPGFHSLGLLLRTLCEQQTEMPPENKKTLIGILEQCALLPKNEIQRLKE